MPRSMRWIVLKPRRHSKTRATCESAVMSLRLLSIEAPALSVRVCGGKESFSPPWSRRAGAKRRGGLMLGQKQLQQVVQETLPARCRPDMSVSSLEQPELLGLLELAFHHT